MLKTSSIKRSSLAALQYEDPVIHIYKPPLRNFAHPLALYICVYMYMGISIHSHTYKILIRTSHETKSAWLGSSATWRSARRRRSSITSSAPARLTLGSRARRGQPQDIDLCRSICVHIGIHIYTRTHTHLFYLMIFVYKCVCVCVC